MERRFSSLGAHAADRREHRLLRRLRGYPALGRDIEARLVLRGAILASPAETPRKSPLGVQGFKLYGLHAESRSSRQPRAWRAAQFACEFREFEARRRCELAFAIRAAAVYGRGVWRDGAFSIFHQPR